jgi:hypothetical protein
MFRVIFYIKVIDVQKQFQNLHCVLLLGRIDQNGGPVIGMIILYPRVLQKKIVTFNILLFDNKNIHQHL